MKINEKEMFPGTFIPQFRSDKLTVGHIPQKGTKTRPRLSFSASEELAISMLNVRFEANKAHSLPLGTEFKIRRLRIYSQTA